MGLQDFIMTIASLAIEFRFSVTSWIRTPRRNQRVGGVTDSLHLSGLAMDIVLDRQADRRHFCLRAKRLGLRVIIYDSHLHVQVN